MKWLDEFRDPSLARPLLDRIGAAAAGLPRTSLMEVCGTHTMAIARHGIRGLLPDNVRLTSGPGCPVCVTPVGFVDHARALARLPGLVVATFGDLVRVPGSSGSLAEQRAAGAHVEVVTSPLAALELARAHPSKQVVFLSVGFETTVPTVAATLLEAERRRIPNFSLLCANKTLPAALALLTARTELSGLLCPGHVSAVTGTGLYEPLAARGVACVVGGFEPLDILLALALLLEQLAAGLPRVQNAYGRVVRAEGNPLARRVVDQVFCACDSAWRGLGVIPGSGLTLKPELRQRDAAARFEVEIEPAREPEGCRCGEILAGLAGPRDCPLFGVSCTPEQPRGACMVSSEGTCAAVHRYGEAGAP